MKLSKSRVIISCIIMFLTLFVYEGSNYGRDIVIQRNIPIEMEDEDIEVKSNDLFLTQIGMRESSGRYGVVNSYGYLGKYQFSLSTLKSLGIQTSRKEFLNSPSLQEKAMVKLLRSNKKTLRKYISKYDESYLHGFYITESGVLAAAHLVGAGNMIKFFKSGKNVKDGYGTKLTDYLQEFSDYKLDID